MKLRPLSGRSTTFRLSTTWPSPDDSLRSSGASAVTVTAWSDAPMSSARSRRTVSPVGITTPSRASGRKPFSSTRTACSPAASAGPVKTPSAAVMAVRMRLLVPAVTVTMALGTAAPA